MMSFLIPKNTTSTDFIQYKIGTIDIILDKQPVTKKLLQIAVLQTKTIVLHFSEHNNSAAQVNNNIVFAFSDGTMSDIPINTASIYTMVANSFTNGKHKVALYGFSSTTIVEMVKFGNRRLGCSTNEVLHPNRLSIGMNFLPDTNNISIFFSVEITNEKEEIESNLTSNTYIFVQNVIPTVMKLNCWKLNKLSIFTRFLVCYFAKIDYSIIYDILQD